MSEEVKAKTVHRQKKVKKVKKNTPVNAKEIKAWLRGIQEFAPEGWTPTPEQWAAVCEKIFLLEENDSMQVQAELPVTDSYGVVSHELPYYPEPHAVEAGRLGAFRSQEPAKADMPKFDSTTVVEGTKSGFV